MCIQWWGTRTLPQGCSWLFISLIPFHGAKNAYSQVWQRFHWQATQYAANIRLGLINTVKRLQTTCLTSLLWSRKIFPLVPSSHVQSYTITIIDLIWNYMSSFYQKLSHMCDYAISNNFVKQAKQRLSQACLCVFEGLLWRHRSEVACCRDWGSGSSSPGRHSEWHESSTVTQLAPGHMTESVELMWFAIVAWLHKGFGKNPKG